MYHFFSTFDLLGLQLFHLSKLRRCVIGLQVETLYFAASFPFHLITYHLYKGPGFHLHHRQLDKISKSRQNRDNETVAPGNRLVMLSIL